jgi:hypothetical protein
MFDEKALTKLVREATTTQVVLKEADIKAIVGSITEEERIAYRYRVLQQEGRSLAERHHAEQSTLDAKYAALRRDCKHRLREYNGDPAGGSDSFYSCPTCGWTS